MNRYFSSYFCFCAIFHSFVCVSEVPVIPASEAFRVAEKIWQNECSKKMEYLTCWNQGEEFASLGIGHFIWYPANQKQLFQQTFPSLILYLSNQNIKIPSWIFVENTTQVIDCPWKSREEFYQEIQSFKMIALREFLYETKKEQALFIAQQLQQSFPFMIGSLTEEQKTLVTDNFYRLFYDVRGLYALIDYLNFKGAGTSSLESYKGENWGLLQVLLAIPKSNDCPVQAFVIAAKDTLKKRVENSPPEKNEQRWLKGWMNRLDTYLAI